MADPGFSHWGGGAVADLPNIEKYLRWLSGLKSRWNQIEAPLTPKSNAFGSRIDRGADRGVVSEEGACNDRHVS